MHTAKVELRSKACWGGTSVLVPSQRSEKARQSRSCMGVSRNSDQRHLAKKHAERCKTTARLTVQAGGMALLMRPNRSRTALSCAAHCKRHDRDLVHRPPIPAEPARRVQ